MAPAHRRWPKRFGLVVLLAVAAGSGWGYFQNGTGTTPTVNTVDVTRGDIQQLVSATGVLEPSNYVDVGAQVSGQLESIHVRVGQTVSEGDLLAEIDPTVYVAKVDATRAQLKNQQAQIQDRNAQLRLAEIQFQRQQNLLRE
ncbi:MAG: biotin/lipoyl-binding protein, partial [Marinobacter sp.]